MSNPRTRSKAQAGAPASAGMQPVGLVVPSTHSRSSSYDNVNAWREKQAAFPASSAGSPDEDGMPPNDDGSVSGSAVTPASSVILKRSSANGDVESVSNDGNKPKRIPTTPHQVRVLTAEMETNPFPDAERRAELAKELGMDRKRVQVWFQNRRQAMRGVGGRAWANGYPGYYNGWTPGSGNTLPPADYPPAYPPPHLAGYPGYPPHPLTHGAPYPPYDRAVWKHPGYPYGPGFHHPHYPPYPPPGHSPAVSPTEGFPGSHYGPPRDPPAAHGHGLVYGLPSRPDGSARLPPSNLQDDLAAMGYQDVKPSITSLADHDSRTGKAQSRANSPILRSAGSESMLHPSAAKRSTSPSSVILGPLDSGFLSRTSSLGELASVASASNESLNLSMARLSPSSALPLPLPPLTPSRVEPGTGSLGLPASLRKSGSISTCGPLPSLADALGDMSCIKLPPLRGVSASRSTSSRGASLSPTQPLDGRQAGTTPSLRRRLSQVSDTMEREAIRPSSRQRLETYPSSTLGSSDTSKVSLSITRTPSPASGETFTKPTLSSRPGTPNSHRGLHKSPTVDDVQMRARRDSVRSVILSDYEEDLKNGRHAITVKLEQHEVLD